MLESLHFKFLTHIMPIPRIWYRYSPSPPPSLVNVVQSGPEMMHTDFSIVFSWGSREGGYLSLLVLWDMGISIFLDIFVQDFSTAVK